MKICIFGAGAIGGYLGVDYRWQDMTFVPLPRPHLKAIQQHGLKLLTEGHSKIARIQASDEPKKFGPQDIVICTLKAHQAYASAAEFIPLMRDDTAFVTAVNGIPWWYFYKSGGSFEGHHLELADPGGRLWDTLGPERAIGCVIHPACEVIAPGVAEHKEFTRFILGEPNGSVSRRVQVLSEVLSGAGFDAPVREDAAAVIAIPIFRRFKLGSVLGYLTAGIIIGPASLGLISSVETTQNIAQFGIVLLMFVIGLELQPSRLWVLRRSIFGLGTAQVGVTTIGVSAAAYFIFGQTWQAALVIGFALSMSSTALVLQLLAERGQLTSQFGRSAFSVLLFQDVSVMPALALLPLLSVASQQSAAPGGWLVIKLIAVLGRCHPGRPLCAASNAAHHRGIAGRRSLHRGGSIDRPGYRAAREPSRFVAVARIFPSRRAAG